MSSTLVFTRGGGRLGNQLLNYANLLAVNLDEPDIDVVDLAFIPYLDGYGNPQMRLTEYQGGSLSRDFQLLLQIGWGVYSIRRSMEIGSVDRLRVVPLHLLAHYRSNAQSIIAGHPHTSYHIPGTHIDQLDLSSPEAKTEIRSKDVTVAAGWAVRAWPLVRKYRIEIQQSMHPGEQYLRAARSYISELKTKYEQLVGVLIRQQDYRNWHNGDYFFNSPQYEKFLSSYAATKPDKDIGFLIASDEEQPSGVFGNGPYHFASGRAVGPNHYLESFAELSLCDVVMTPPSTFSTFAAFLGDVPLVPIHENSLKDGWTHLNNPLLDSINDPHMSESVK